MEDILKGSKVYRENPEKQFKEINAISKEIERIECNDENELNFAKFHKPYAKKWRKFVWKYTKQGRFAPKFLFRSKGVALEWYPPKEDFMLVKEVKVYNLFTKKYTTICIILILLKRLLCLKRNWKVILILIL